MAASLSRNACGVPSGMRPWIRPFTSGLMLTFRPRLAPNSWSAAARS